MSTTITVYAVSDMTGETVGHVVRAAARCVGPTR